MAQIAEQHDRRLAARDMGAGRYDQRPDDQLLDVRKYFLGDRLDMFGIERQPFGSDLRHGFSLVFLAAANGSFTTTGPRSRSKKAGDPDPRILTSTIGRLNEGARNRNEIGVRLRRDRYPQNLPKKLSKRNFHG